MIIHVSIPAKNPEKVAKVIAELWGGEAFLFPPFPGAYTAMAGDHRGSAIEVYPHDMILRPAVGARDVEGVNCKPQTSFSACHVAIETALTEEEVFSIADRERWHCKSLRRGDVFGVIEFWVENSFMLEVFTSEMSDEYRSKVTIDGWRSMLNAGLEHRSESTASS
ncbi:hypothetical protein [Pseudomonas sp. OTU5201]|uniref:hypothetical protein n=1 Tax=Pseudomonas sp. OTU5201 TaxID=3043850 RepID=UPI00313C9FA2